jgi:adenylate cyclase
MDAQLIDPAEIKAVARERAAPIVDWLLAERVRATRMTHFMHNYCTRLREIGLPLERATFHIRQLHPQLLATTVLWNREAGGAVELGREHGIENQPFFQKSPINVVFSTGESYRRRLNDGRPFEFPILQDLAEQGMTDYVVNLIPFSGSHPAAHSLATREPNGFSDLDLAIMDAITPTLGAVLELSETRRTAQTLLNTYVGRQAGKRVLKGRIKRGDGDIIEAVIWVSDLRGFTEFSETAGLQDVIAHLNTYFDCIGQAIERHGGEILKFIGDAVLAIFTSEPGEDALVAASTRAATAAREALAELTALNASRREQGLPLIQCGIGLHVGEVMYGNIGAADRLDFTVIGPAVNRAARLETLTAELGLPVLASREFAEMTNQTCHPLGAFTLKGIGRPQEVYDLAGCTNAMPVPGVKEDVVGRATA